MLIESPYGSTLSEAFKLASERGILPTWMGTAEIKELEEGIKARAVFSARTTHAGYLQALRNELNKLIEGGYGSTAAEIRVALKNKLREIGYDPTTGFPGDEALGIPPAKPGSLRDLSSDKRINLILDTQMQLMAGKGQQQRGLEPAALDLFPAYELVRVRNVRMPRDWLKRWKIAAENVDWQGVSKLAFEQGRMIALKTSPVWPAIGSHHLFEDALDVAFPPFAFSSGMGWDVKDREEALQWGLELPDTPITDLDAWLKKHATGGGYNLKEMARTLPQVQSSTHGLDADFISALKKKIAGVEAREGRLTMGGVTDSAVQRALDRRAERGTRTNALCDGLDCLLLLKTEP